MLRTELEAAGYDAHAASDGAAALALAEACPPDVIITELAMPNMDGFAPLDGGNL